MIPVPQRDAGGVPTPGQAARLAAEILGDVGTRLSHVLRAGRIASQLSGLFDEEEGRLLVAAATLHDIGYAPPIAQTGFHPLDGALYLTAQGYSRRLAGLVAHHSLSYLNAPAHGIADLEAIFPRESGMLADALMYADMHSAPDGSQIPGEQRLADIASRHSYPATPQRLSEIRAALERVASAARAAGLVGWAEVTQELDLSNEVSLHVGDPAEAAQI